MHVQQNDSDVRAARGEREADLVAFAARTLREKIRQQNLGAVPLVLRTKGGFTTPKGHSVSVNVNIDGGPVIDATLIYEGGEGQRRVRAL